ncbi:RNA polymerase sigma factor [Maribellus luteus]|uniref:RNA polymerase sigma factor n=1 Tax=Maribellus luteus TaxID=2305463 RepID=UPI0019D4BD12|nr:RNA polymerase sigma factor [Maribellus luteus]
MTQQEFKELFELHFAQVRNYVFYRSGDTEIATDIAQETFMKVWEKNGSFSADRITGLLYKIANDLFISHYRKEQRSFQFFKHYRPEAETRSPEDELAFEQLKTRYDKALQHMQENQRTVFLMSRVENLKYTEIAEMCMISVKAVEKRMKKALEYLQVNLKANE